MGKRFAVAGYQNSGKSYPRRWIPDGHNVVLLQPSTKFPHLFTGPKNAHRLTAAQLDQAEKEGTRTAVTDFDLVSPENTFKNYQEAYARLPEKEKTMIPIEGNREAYMIMDVLKGMLKYKAAGYFKPEHIKGNIFTVPFFDALEVALDFVDKHMYWVHTVILPDFTHFITERITSDEFLNNTGNGGAYQRYLNLAADAFKGFIRKSDSLRKDLVVVTEYHIEYVEAENRYELFVPGGRMVKEKILPSSYYDFFLFTDVEFSSLDDDAEPNYRYVTRRTRKYPEARSMGLFQDLYVPNNLHTALTEFRKYYNIPVQYEKPAIVNK